MAGTAVDTHLGGRGVDEDLLSLFPSFVRYEAPSVVPGVVVGSTITLLDHDGARGHTSIPAARLAAAKSAAREAFMASQQQQQLVAPLGCHGAAVSTGGSGTRKDPAHRLPTPPVAGRRHMHDGRGTRKDTGREPPAKEKDSRAGAATITAAPLPVQSRLSPSSSSQRQHTLASLMRASTKPDSFVAQILEGMFPPRLTAVDLDGRGAALGGARNGVGRVDVWNDDVPAAAEIAPRATDAHPSGEPPQSPTTTPSPARRHHKDGEVLPISVQHVSRSPATREEVALLHDALRHRLQQRRAKPSDICPIRRQVYTDVFDELIRQVTVEEPARGVLLQRIKDEVDHTLAVHADLLARGHFFAARKMQASQDGRISGSADGHPAASNRGSIRALQLQLEELQEGKKLLEARRHELLVARDARERQIDEERLARNKACQEELTYLRRVNQQLSLRLKAETERTSATHNGRAGGEHAGDATTEAPATEQ